MLDINFIRENPEIVKNSEQRRNHDVKNIDKIIQLDLNWRKTLKSLEELKHHRNVVSEEINNAKKAKNESLADKKIQEMRLVVNDIHEKETNVAQLLDQRNALIKTIGNILHESVPHGIDDTQNKELKKFGKIPQFNFPIKDHIELGLELDLIDWDTAAKNSGSRVFGGSIPIN